MRIPENAKVITGIETAVRMKGLVALPINSFAVVDIEPELVSDLSPNPIGSGFAIPVMRSFVGELKLQSCEEANVFYATDITDPSAPENLDRIPTPSAIIENVWTHGYKRELEEVLVDGNTTVLAGLYRDKLGAMQNHDTAYDVFLYVWYKLENPKR
ncbi:MAG: hypothetical protein HY841_00915 [Bacteroidetes bacterium]|nr:hypothetical protein [Bacteroidota bacterium]